MTELAGAGSWAGGWNEPGVQSIVIVVGGTAGTGVFVYDPAFVLGDLIASITDATTGPLGETTFKGITDYVPYSGAIVAVQLNQLGGGLPGLALSDTAHAPFSPAGIFGASGGTAGLDQALAILSAGQVTNADVTASVSVQTSVTNAGPSLARVTAQQIIVGVGSVDVIVTPSGDTTGATDLTVLIAALALGGSVQLLQGTYYLSGQLAWANAQLTGHGDDTTIIPGSAWSGTAMLAPGANAAALNITGYGGTNTRSSNPATDFIAPTSTWWRTEGIRCQYMNGWIINSAPGTGTHGTIRNIKGEHNGGGISVNAGTGAGVTAEINISDIDIQNCETNEVLFLSAVNDILVAGPVNGSIAGTNAVNGITVQGACQTCQLRGLDVGGGRGTGVLVFQDAGGHSPTEIEVGPGTVQQGAVGVVVNGAAARLAFTGLWAKGCQGDGWQWNGTGAFNEMTACGGNTNNAAAGTAYDVNVTSTAHLLNNGFRYVSGAVTAGRNLTAAGNHYTEANPPAALTTAGNAPAGW